MLQHVMTIASYMHTVADWEYPALCVWVNCMQYEYLTVCKSCAAGYCSQAILVHSWPLSFGTPILELI